MVLLDERVSAPDKTGTASLPPRGPKPKFNVWKGYESRYTRRKANKKRNTYVQNQNMRTQFLREDEKSRLDEISSTYKTRMRAIRGETGNRTGFKSFTPKVNREDLADRGLKYSPAVQRETLTDAYNGMFDDKESAKASFDSLPNNLRTSLFYSLKKQDEDLELYSPELRPLIEAAKIGDSGSLSEIINSRQFISEIDSVAKQRIAYERKLNEPKPKYTPRTLSQVLKRYDQPTNYNEVTELEEGDWEIYYSLNLGDHSNRVEDIMRMDKEDDNGFPRFRISFTNINTNEKSSKIVSTDPNKVVSYLEANQYDTSHIKVKEKETPVFGPSKGELGAEALPNQIKAFYAKNYPNTTLGEFKYIGADDAGRGKYEVEVVEEDGIPRKREFTYDNTLPMNLDKQPKTSIELENQLFTKNIQDAGFEVVKEKGVYTKDGYKKEKVYHTQSGMEAKVVEYPNGQSQIVYNIDWERPEVIQEVERIAEEQTNGDIKLAKERFQGIVHYMTLQINELDKARANGVDVDSDTPEAKANFEKYSNISFNKAQWGLSGEARKMWARPEPKQLSGIQKAVAGAIEWGLDTKVFTSLVGANTPEEIERFYAPLRNIPYIGKETEMAFRGIASPIGLATLLLPGGAAFAIAGGGASIGLGAGGRQLEEAGRDIFGDNKTLLDIGGFKLKSDAVELPISSKMGAGGTAAAFAAVALGSMLFRKPSLIRNAKFATVGFGAGAVAGEVDLLPFGEEGKKFVVGPGAAGQFAGAFAGPSQIETARSVIHGAYKNPAGFKNIPKNIREMSWVQSSARALDRQVYNRGLSDTRLVPLVEGNVVEISSNVAGGGRTGTIVKTNASGGHSIRFDGQKKNKIYSDKDLIYRESNQTDVQHVTGRNLTVKEAIDEIEAIPNPLRSADEASRLKTLKTEYNWRVDQMNKMIESGAVDQTRREALNTPIFIPDNMPKGYELMSQGTMWTPEGRRGVIVKKDFAKKMNSKDSETNVAANKLYDEKVQSLQAEIVEANMSPEMRTLRDAGTKITNDIIEPAVANYGLEKQSTTTAVESGGTKLIAPDGTIYGERSGSVETFLNETNGIMGSTLRENGFATIHEGENGITIILGRENDLDNVQSYLNEKINSVPNNTPVTMIVGKEIHTGTVGGLKRNPKYIQRMNEKGIKITGALDNVPSHQVRSTLRNILTGDVDDAQSLEVLERVQNELDDIGIDLSLMDANEANLWIAKYYDSLGKIIDPDSAPALLSVEARKKNIHELYLRAENTPEGSYRIFEMSDNLPTEYVYAIANKTYTPPLMNMIHRAFDKIDSILGYDKALFKQRFVGATLHIEEKGNSFIISQLVDGVDRMEVMINPFAVLENTNVAALTPEMIVQKYLRTVIHEAAHRYEIHNTMDSDTAFEEALKFTYEQVTGEYEGIFNDFLADFNENIIRKGLLDELTGDGYNYLTTIDDIKGRNLFIQDEAGPIKEGFNNGDRETARDGTRGVEGSTRRQTRIDGSKGLSQFGEKLRARSRRRVQQRNRGEGNKRYSELRENANIQRVVPHPGTADPLGFLDEIDINQQLRLGEPGLMRKQKSKFLDEEYYIPENTEYEGEFQTLTDWEENRRLEGPGGRWESDGFIKTYKDTNGNGVMTFFKFKPQEKSVEIDLFGQAPIGKTQRIKDVETGELTGYMPTGPGVFVNILRDIRDMMNANLEYHFIGKVVNPKLADILERFGFNIEKNTRQTAIDQVAVWDFDLTQGDVTPVEIVREIFRDDKYLVFRRKLTTLDEYMNDTFESLTADKLIDALLDSAQNDPTHVTSFYLDKDIIEAPPSIRRKMTRDEIVRSKSRKPADVDINQRLLLDHTPTSFRDFEVTSNDPINAKYVSLPDTVKLMNIDDFMIEYADDVSLDFKIHGNEINFDLTTQGVEMGEQGRASIGVLGKVLKDVKNIADQNPNYKLKAVIANTYLGRTLSRLGIAKFTSAENFLASLDNMSKAELVDEGITLGITTAKTSELVSETELRRTIKNRRDGNLYQGPITISREGLDRLFTLEKRPIKLKNVTFDKEIVANVINEQDRIVNPGEVDPLGWINQRESFVADAEKFNKDAEGKWRQPYVADETRRLFIDMMDGGVKRDADGFVYRIGGIEQFESSFVNTDIGRIALKAIENERKLHWPDPDRDLVIKQTIDEAREKGIVSLEVEDRLSYARDTFTRAKEYSDEYINENLIVYDVRDRIVKQTLISSDKVTGNFVITSDGRASIGHTEHGVLIQTLMKQDGGFGNRRYLDYLTNGDIFLGIPNYFRLHELGIQGAFDKMSAAAKSRVVELAKATDAEGVAIYNPHTQSIDEALRFTIKELETNAFETQSKEHVKKLRARYEARKKAQVDIDNINQQEKFARTSDYGKRQFRKEITKLTPDQVYTQKYGKQERTVIDSSGLVALNVEHYNTAIENMFGNVVNKQQALEQGKYYMTNTNYFNEGELTVEGNVEHLPERVLDRVLQVAKQNNQEFIRFWTPWSSDIDTAVSIPTKKLEKTRSIKTETTRSKVRALLAKNLDQSAIPEDRLERLIPDTIAKNDRISITAGQFINKEGRYITRAKSGKWIIELDNGQKVNVNREDFTKVGSRDNLLDSLERPMPRVLRADRIKELEEDIIPNTKGNNKTKAEQELALLKDEEKLLNYIETTYPGVKELQDELVNIVQDLEKETTRSGQARQLEVGDIVQLSQDYKGKKVTLVKKLADGWSVRHASGVEIKVKFGDISNNILPTKGFVGRGGHIAALRKRAGTILQAIEAKTFPITETIDELPLHQQLYETVLAVETPRLEQLYSRYNDLIMDAYAAQYMGDKARQAEISAEITVVMGEAREIREAASEAVSHLSSTEGGRSGSTHIRLTPVLPDNPFMEFVRSAFRLDVNDRPIQQLPITPKGAMQLGAKIPILKSGIAFFNTSAIHVNNWLGRHFIGWKRLTNYIDSNMDNAYQQAKGLKDPFKYDKFHRETNTGMYLGDVFENWWAEGSNNPDMTLRKSGSARRSFLNDPRLTEMDNYFDIHNRIRLDAIENARKLGLDVPNIWFEYLHAFRDVLHDGKVSMRAIRSTRREPGSFKHRFYESMLEGAMDGVIYDFNFTEVTVIGARQIQKYAADKAFLRAIGNERGVPIKLFAAQKNRLELTVARKEFSRAKVMRDYVNQSKRGNPPKPILREGKHMQPVPTEIEELLSTVADLNARGLRGAEKRAAISRYVDLAENVYKKYSREVKTAQSDRKIAVESVNRSRQQAKHFSQGIVDEFSLTPEQWVETSMAPVTQFPELNGKLFLQQDVDWLLKYVATSTNPVVQIANTTKKYTGIMRTAQTTYDVGFWTIQGLGLLAVDFARFGQNTLTGHPLKALSAVSKDSAWGNAVYRSLQGFTNPRAVDEWWNNQKIMHPEQYANFTRYARISGIAEDITNIGVLEKGEAKIPLLRDLKITKRTGIAISHFLNGGAWEIWKALEPLANTPYKMEELGSFARNITGRAAVAEDGMSEGQLAIERALLYAPSFTRAAFNILTKAAFDPASFGGRLALKSLAGLTGGMMMMATAAAVSKQLVNNNGDYSKLDWEDLSDEVKDIMNPLSGKFASIRVGDANYGLGGNIRSSLMLLSRLVRAGVEDPKALGEGDLSQLATFDPFAKELLPWDFNNGAPFVNYNHPFLKWFRGKSSPVVSTAIDLFAQEDYNGYALDDPSDYLKLPARLLPLSFQSMMQYDGGWKDRLGVGLGSFIGLRTSEIYKSDLYHEQAERDLGAPWEELKGTERLRQAQEDEEHFEELYNAHQEYVTDLRKKNNEYQKLTDYVATRRDERNTELMKLSQTIDWSSPGGGEVYREQAKFIKAKYLDDYEQEAARLGIQINDFEGADDRNKDAVLGDKLSLIQLEDFTDARGVPDYDAFNEAKEKIIRQMSPEEQKAVRNKKYRSYNNPGLETIERRKDNAAKLWEPYINAPKYKGLTVEEGESVDLLNEKISEAMDRYYLENPNGRTVYKKDILRNLYNNTSDPEKKRLIKVAYVLSFEKLRKFVMDDTKEMLVMNNPDFAVFYPNVFFDLTEENQEKWNEMYSNRRGVRIYDYINNDDDYNLSE